EDVESVACLQRWFGSLLTLDGLRCQKILQLVGPPRAGKGTIERVVRAAVGNANVCAPTLASLASDFGLWPLVGKTLAVVTDARLSGRADSVAVGERLLAVSGGDPVTVNGKYRDQFTAVLPTRFLVLTNQVLRLEDASGALPSRFVTLQLTNSWLGREDT